MTGAQQGEGGLHLLFVCTGNICRSPTAERLVRAHAAEHGLSGLTASSAGTHAVVGSAMDPASEAVLQRLGGEGDGFVAHQLTAADVRSADLVLTMTTRHRTTVLEAHPAALRRTFTLREAARLLRGSDATVPLVARLGAARARNGTRGEEDVSDPYRRGEGAHAEAGAAIAEALAPLLDAIRSDHEA